MREFLKGLELDKETIDTIMAEVGKAHTGLKEQIEELKGKVSEYEGQIKELNGVIEKNQDELKNLETITNENKDLKADIQLNRKKKKKEFNKFVRSEVLSKVDDKVDFSKALESFKKENPQYFGDVQVTKVQTSPNLNAGGVKPQTTNDIFNNMIRGN